MPALLARAAAALLAAILLAPVASLAYEAAQGSGALWPHLLAYVLPQALRDTALLLAGVGALAALLGTGGAWLVTAYAFPGRRFLEIALVLPLAVPTYVVAYSYLDLTHPLGPIPTGLRALLGLTRPRDLTLPDLRSLPGCIGLIGLVLYPYVYLPTRALFAMRAGTLLEQARLLGAGPVRLFFAVALPLARPAIALGVGLAVMETLNDVGAAEFLGVRTLTVQVYATWVNRSDLAGAAGIALSMLGCVLLLVALERWARGGRDYGSTAKRDRPAAPQLLGRGAGALALLLGLVPVALGFALPAGYLAFAALRHLARAGLPAALPAQVGNTVLYAAGATLVTAVIGFLVAARADPAAAARGGRTRRGLIRLAGLGYALPGTVLAVGLLTPLALVDRGIGLVGLGSGGALILAYLVRFLTVAAGAGEAGLARVPAALSDAARVLGRSRLAALVQVQWPLAWPALASGALLVFVDCAKELPIALLLRPLNVETLATHLYGEAARGTYEDAALSALLIVAVGLIPVALLLRAPGAAPAARAGLAPRDAASDPA